MYERDAVVQLQFTVTLVIKQLDHCERSEHTLFNHRMCGEGVQYCVLAIGR